MIRFENESQVVEFIRNARKEAESDRSTQAAYSSKCRLYYLGVQWLRQGDAPAGTSRLQVAMRNLLGNNGPIRAIVNRITRLIIQVNSATNPQRLHSDVLPPEYATDITDSFTADAMETAVNRAIDDCGLLASARNANFNRTVAGCHGVGLALHRATDQQGRPYTRTKAFDFDPQRLTLDPGNTSIDLRQHEFVIYSDVLTVHQLERMFGPDLRAAIDESKMATVASLMPVEMRFNALSDGIMYSQYAQHSGTKAALVHFLHTKDADGRFSGYYIAVEAPFKQMGKDAMRVVNFDTPVSPFGGDGLPYVMLSGHMRPASRMAISDVGMMIDDQDRLNLTASLYLQQIYNYTGRGSWLVDRRWVGRKSSDDEVAARLRRNVVVGDTMDPSAKPPVYVGLPEPSHGMQQTVRDYAEEMRQQVFRSEAHQGQTKSHVTTTAFLRTQELAELPMDDRVSDDVRAYQTLIKVLAGTLVLQINQRSSPVIRSLQDAGLGPQELGALDSVNPYGVPYQIVVRDQAIRPLSRTQRRQNLLDAAAIGVVSPQKVARTLARDLDTPLSESDKAMTQFARQMAIEVMMGVEWQPLPLSEGGETLIEEFQSAIISRRARQIPGAMDRLTRAIILQRQAIAEEAMIAQGPAQAGAGSAAQPAPAETLSLQSVIDAGGGQLDAA